MNRIKQSLKNFYNFIIFSYFIAKEKIFGSKSPGLILQIIKKFISLEYPNYPESYYLGRDMKKSSDLLGALIDSYTETKSETTLNQILEVLKEEFIQRVENHGRKQF